MDLTNASAIVTGGAGGVGSATVRRLAQKGAKAVTVRATRSATSENSVKAKFALWGFSEVRVHGILGSSRQAEGGGIICFVGRVCTR
jgi:NAD(P)-dependent dehydrogenase (short-subunit alcohol dehydrogenase family)